MSQFSSLAQRVFRMVEMGRGGEARIRESQSHRLLRYFGRNGTKNAEPVSV